jgi:3-deoxy-7-phosphoheptulonate synthase
VIIVMAHDATEEQIKAIVKKVEEKGLKAEISKGAERTVIGVVGINAISYREAFAHMPGIHEIVPISTPYKLASREFKREDSVVRVGDVNIGPGTLTVIAGPCSVENEHMLMETAWAVKKAGAKLLRGGAFKPRTSPYTFQGLGEEGLRLLAEARKATGLGVVSEVMSPGDVEVVAQYVDMLQIGTRNMQNYPLLQEVGRTQKPVLLKRGMSSTVEEWLLSAEYLLSRGNKNVVLCERGIRTFEHATRFTLDINAVPLVKELSHLPVIVDPSHGTGKWSLVGPVSLAAVAAGASGLLIEVHPKPEEALSDGAQSLTIEAFNDLMSKIKKLCTALDIKID